MNKKGFTLIEIAMVLVVIGILLGIGTGMMGMLTKRTKLIESREVVKSAKEALSGYAVKYGYLPDTDIGLSGARTLDAWGRSLLYARPASLGGACTGTCTSSVCSTGIGSCGICGLTSTDRTIYECTNATCSTSNTKPNIAFIVYSTGEDADGLGTTTKPTAAPACPAGTCYWIREQATSDASYTLEYDDIVQYVTLDEIRDARSCSFNITTQTLPDAKVGTVYNATGIQLQASGGQTPYTSWLVTTGALPTGITLSSPGGLLSGTPTTAGVYNFTVTLTDANSVTTSKTFTLNVLETLAIANQTLPDARTGAAYSITLYGTGGTGAYAWSTGQAIGACPAGTVQIVATNIGLCLNTTTGVLSSAIVATPYPITAGVYSFTVTLTANAITTSRTFALNVIDSCAAGGINVANRTTVIRYYKKNNATTGVTGCTAWPIAAPAIVNVLPVDILYPFTSNTCATRSCTTTYPAPNYMSYSVWQATDVNENCSTSWLTYGAANCAPQDL